MVDVRTLPLEKRQAAADQIRIMGDFVLPELEYFNSAPCAKHSSVEEGLEQIPPCRRCGIKFRKHQKVGIAWLYMRGKGLIADQVGTGKTPQAAGLLAILKQIGELNQGRVVVVCRPAAIDQWLEELNRLVPRLNVVVAGGTRQQRINTYLTTWEVMLIGHQMFCKDVDLINNNFPVAALVIDDVDPLRNRSNTTAYAIKQLARASSRVVVFTATGLQKRLLELHSVLEPVGGLEALGSADRARRRYIREETVKLYNPRAGRVVNTRQTTGYRNLDEFKEQIRPLILRRTSEDIDDVELPVISPNNIFLDLYPAQRERYETLRRGVLQIIRTEGTRVSRVEAAAKFLYGAQICAGLSTLGEPDGPSTSIKLDWVQEALDGDLGDEKVVVFCQFTNTVETLMNRLTQAGIGHGVIWGRNRDRAARAEVRRRFWDDRSCRVLIGTSAIEQSLNLQVSRHLINVDQIMNPARMTQLAGRIRRDGSSYKTVYIHNLFARNTQEEGYLEVLEREQALADYIWDERSQLFEALHPLALLQLIGARR